MESILKADIFFFVTTIAVVVLVLFFLVALFYFIKIVRNFYKISKILKNDANSELRELGEQIRQSPLFTFLFGKEKNKKGNDQPNNKKII